MFNFLNESENIASGLATETLVAAGFFTDVKRTTFLGVKWSETNPVAASFTQCHILLDDFNDRCGGPHPLDVVFNKCHAGEANPRVEWTVYPD